MLPPGRDSVECAHEESQCIRTPSPLNGIDTEEQTILAPHSVRDVKPDYPPAMQERRVQGTVVVESTISRSGCAVDLKVKHSVAPALDVAAVRAVSQWTFTPTRVGDHPVPVVMTVTVKFSLN